MLIWGTLWLINWNVIDMNLRFPQIARCKTERSSFHWYVHVFLSSLLEIRLLIKGHKLLDDGVCDEIGHTPTILSDPINWSKWWTDDRSWFSKLIPNTTGEGLNLHLSNGDLTAHDDGVSRFVSSCNGDRVASTFSNAFSWMKYFVFQLRFYWSLFLRVHLTITQHWFR